MQRQIQSRLQDDLENLSSIMVIANAYFIVNNTKRNSTSIRRSFCKKKPYDSESDIELHKKLVNKLGSQLVFEIVYKTS